MTRTHPAWVRCGQTPTIRWCDATWRREDYAIHVLLSLQEHYLPHMIRSRVKLWCSGVSDPQLAGFVDKTMLDNDHKAILESRYAYELALVSILRDDLDKTKYYLNCCLQAFYQVLSSALLMVLVVTGTLSHVQDWSSLSDLQTRSRLARLQRLQPMTEVKEYVEFMSVAGRCIEMFSTCVINECLLASQPQLTLAVPVQ